MSNNPKCYLRQIKHYISVNEETLIGTIAIFLFIKFENICQWLGIKAKLYIIYTLFFFMFFRTPLETKTIFFLHWSFSKLILIRYTNCKNLRLSGYRTYRYIYVRILETITYKNFKRILYNFSQ